MKSSKPYVSVIAAASLALTAMVQAQSDSPSPRSNRTGAANDMTSPGASTSNSGSAMSQDKAHGSAALAGSTSGIARVTKDEVKSRLTAKDLIGAAVYDSAGERIGDIADIDLRGTLPSALASSFASGNAMSSDTMGASGSQQSAGSVGDQSASGSLQSTGSQSTATGNATGSGSTMQRSSGAQSPGSSGSQRSYAQSSGTTGSSSAWESTASAGQATIYVSVGGLWGIGDDLVGVSASQLSYNSSNQRFELSASKADVVALAEQHAGSGSLASTSRTGSSDNAMRSGSSTTAGKQSFNDEAARLQNALATDPAISSFASAVSVMANGEDLELHGTVENKDQQKQILEAARRATSRNVKDKLNVRR